VTSQTYEFRVTAYNDVGAGLPSVPTPLDVATIPSKPGKPVKVLSTLTEIQIEWTTPESNGGAPIQTYIVQMESSLGVGFNEVAETSSLTSMISGLQSGITYYFRIIAENSVGQSTVSDVTSITCGVVPNRPSEPILVSQSDSHIEFSYSAAANFGEPPVTGFRILWNEGNGFYFTTLYIVSDPLHLTFSMSDNVMTGLTYEFRVVAINEIGESEPSPILDILAA